MIILDRQKNENARNYAYRVLLQNILDLTLAPGTAVSENEISSELGISRTPVREAMIELKKIGMVDILPQRGTYITRIDYAIIDEAQFVRLVLELAIIKRACVSIPPNYSILLHSNLDRQQLCLEQKEDLKILSLDNEFHKLLFEAVGKQWSYNIVQSQMAHFDRLRYLSLKTLDASRTVSDHRAILESVEAHDRDRAEELMNQHLNRHHLEKDELIKIHPDYFVQPGK